jgi:hypothetical protein
LRTKVITTWWLLLLSLCIKQVHRREEARWINIRNHFKIIDEIFVIMKRVWLFWFLLHSISVNLCYKFFNIHNPWIWFQLMYAIFHCNFPSNFMHKHLVQNMSFQILIVIKWFKKWFLNFWTYICDITCSWTSSNFLSSYN